METVCRIEVHNLLLKFNATTFVGYNVNSIVINRRVVMSTYIDQPSDNHYQAIKSALDLNHG